jgi:polyribonucleotide nucleotidyltransferase
MATSGSLIRWFQALVGGDELTLLDEEAAATAPAEVLCLPYFLGEKSPLHDPDLRGVYAGMHLGHTRANLYRSVLEAIAFGHEQCRRLARMQKELMAQAAKPRWAFDPNAGKDLALASRVRELASAKLAAALGTHEKHARSEAVSRVFDDVWAGLGLEDAKKGAVRAAFEEAESAEVRRMIVERGLRVDGARSPRSVRSRPRSRICRGPRLVAVHARRDPGPGLGHARYQVRRAEDRGARGRVLSPFLLHYNFPSFSVGEVRRRLALPP